MSETRPGYQLIFGGNGVGVNIHPTEELAWLEAIDDCVNDIDITHILRRVQCGDIK
jgi:hypothetical protein